MDNINYEKKYKELLDKYTCLMLEYKQLTQKARKWRKAKKRWKNKWLKLSARMANRTADLAEITENREDTNEVNTYNCIWESNHNTPNR